jgi:hypothetical protein
MKVPTLFAKAPVTLNDNPKSAPEETWNRPPDPRPQLSFDSTQIPDVANWKVGEKYLVEVSLEMIESRLDKSYKGDRTICRFIVTQVAVEDEKKEKNEQIDMNSYKN